MCFNMNVSLSPLISCDLGNLAYCRVPRYRDVTAGTLTATDTYALHMHMCGRGMGAGIRKIKAIR